MAIAVVNPVGKDLQLEDAAKLIPPPPPIAPTAAPTYVPLSDALVQDAPVVTPPPGGQFSGEGGTPFGSHAVAYETLPVLQYAPRGDGSQVGYWYNGETGDYRFGRQLDGPPDVDPGWHWFLGTAVDTFDPYAPPPVLKFDPDTATPNDPETAPRPGDAETMPVPRGQQPEKSPVAPAIPESTPVGPVTGKVGGFDLALVPWWGWVVAAAFVGAKVLK